MYWLYGAPSIYAVNQHEPAIHHVAPISRDDAPRLSAHNDGNTASNSNTSDSTRSDGDNQDSTSSPTSRTIRRSSLDILSGQELVDNADDAPAYSPRIICLRTSRSAQVFVSLTATSFTVWQTKPTVALARIDRSTKSLDLYGTNIDLQLNPDLTTLVVQTEKHFLVTYDLSIRPDVTVYKNIFADSSGNHSRHRSFSGRGKSRGDEEEVAGPGEGGGIKDVSLALRSIVRIDAGIGVLLAFDKELIISTKQPAMIQCVKWTSENWAERSTTEVLTDLSWISPDVVISEMIYDRPMNLSCWITDDGKVSAVLRVSKRLPTDPDTRIQTFQGYTFHSPAGGVTKGLRVAINARFSLLAVGSEEGNIFVYTARDYQGHIPLSHKLDCPSSLTGRLNFLTWSPDGYCLLVGYENGWATWSVYGTPSASSFSAYCDRDIAKMHEEQWLLGARDGLWIGNGAQFLLLGQPPDINASTEAVSDQLWVVDVARSAVTGCYCSANIARSLLQTNTGFMVYRGYELPEINALSTEQGLWNHVQVPAHYLANQWPIRSAVISSDGRYVAVAGRRGLAHYSVHSGRWKTFEDALIESSFTVRGGMTWYQHVLIAAVETSESHEIRVYSREAALDHDNIMQVEVLPAPVVLISPSGEDSLLVYTYENQLIHYLISVDGSTVRLVQVGQITLHGIIRAPPRVRALSWILPEEQIANGDPAQDVATATVIFIVDGKMVLLQPATNEDGELKYEMRIIAHNVEYHVLMRDQQHFQLPDVRRASILSPNTATPVEMTQNDLRDSLWYFDGKQMNVWTDVQDVLSSASSESSREVPSPVRIPTDFYPLAVLMSKGVLFGAEPDMMQRRDLSFSSLRFATRTHLFIPPILRHHLTHFNSPAALYLTHQYSHLPYLPHALEVLLHDVLDDEVDSPPTSPEAASLPTLLSFLSSSPHFLDIVVQCTRKTEVRSWRTLFKYLPPAKQLFEQALSQGLLITAGGYLLVLHTLEEDNDGSLTTPVDSRSTAGDITPTPSSPRTGSPSKYFQLSIGTATREVRAEKEREDQVVRLLSAASDKGEWALCKELARFLMALDSSGRMLRGAMERVSLTGKANIARNGLGIGNDNVTTRGHGQRRIDEEVERGYFG